MNKGTSEMELEMKEKRCSQVRVDLPGESRGTEGMFPIQQSNKKIILMIASNINKITTL